MSEYYKAELVFYKYFKVESEKFIEVGHVILLYFELLLVKKFLKLGQKSSKNEDFMRLAL